MFTSEKRLSGVDVAKAREGQLNNNVESSVFVCIFFVNVSSLSLVHNNQPMRKIRSHKI